jgi:predicted glutamine amidotransferase
MCIAIYKPQGKEIDKKKLEMCWKSNQHGVGFAYVEDGKIHIKRFLKKDRAFEYYDKNKHRSLMIHFRNASAGKVHIINVHPFKVGKGMVMCHNGTFPYEVRKENRDASDTRLFAKSWLSKLPNGWEENSQILNYLEDFMGTSKVILLRKDGTFFILNEQKGEWVDDIWYSNDYYKKERTKPKVYSSSSYGYGSSANAGYYRQSYDEPAYQGEFALRNGRYIPLGAEAEKCAICDTKLTYYEKVRDNVCITCKTVSTVNGGTI